MHFSLFAYRNIINITDKLRTSCQKMQSNRFVGVVNTATKRLTETFFLTEIHYGNSYSTVGNCNIASTEEMIHTYRVRKPM